MNYEHRELERYRFNADMSNVTILHYSSHGAVCVMWCVLRASVGDAGCMCSRAGAAYWLSGVHRRSLLWFGGT
jgi:hypothetical protein